MEELLYDIEKLIDEYEKEKFIFLKVERKRKKKQREEIKKKIEELKNTIREIKKKFNLKEETLTDIAIISSRASKIWEILCDMKTEKMKRYGKAPDGFHDVFDPVVNKMIKLVEEMI